MGYRFLELVRPAAAGWVDRSLFGVHEPQISAFQEMDQELRSLDMVFKGVTVEFTWESGLVSNPVNEMHALGADREAIESYIDDAGRNIEIKVSIPVASVVSGTVILESEMTNDELLSVDFRKSEDDELPRLRYIRRSSEREEEAGGSEEKLEEFEQKGGFYEVSLKRNYTNHELSEAVRLVFDCNGSWSGNSGVSDVFLMEF